MPILFEQIPNYLRVSRRPPCPFFLRSYLAVAPPSHGFSLVEMLVVVGILSFLAVLALPMTELAEVRLRERKLVQNLTDIRFAIDRYRKAHLSSYPPTFAALLNPIPDEFLKPAAINGPFLATDSLINPFIPGQNSYAAASEAFLWDIRDADTSNDADDDWTLGVRDPFAPFGAQGGVVDIRFPKGGVAGWETAIDGTAYDQW